MPAASKVRTYFAGLNTVSSLEGGVIESFGYYHDHGQCYTYEPPINATSEKPIPGQKNGYKIFVKYLPGNTSSSMVPGGMDIFVHDPGQVWTENPLLPARGAHFYVKSGLQAFVKITNTYYKYLDSSEQHCIERTPDNSSQSEVTCLFN